MKISVYTTPGCQPCRITNKFLSEHNIAFEEFDGRAHIDELREEGFVQFPIIKTENDAWSGLRPDKLKALV